MYNYQYYRSDPIKQGNYERSNEILCSVDSLAVGH